MPTRMLQTILAIVLLIGAVTAFTSVPLLKEPEEKILCTLPSHDLHEYFSLFTLLLDPSTAASSADLEG